MMHNYAATLHYRLYKMASSTTPYSDEYANEFRKLDSFLGVTLFHIEEGKQLACNGVLSTTIEELNDLITSLDKPDLPFRGITLQQEKYAFIRNLMKVDSEIFFFDRVTNNEDEKKIRFF